MKKLLISFLLGLTVFFSFAPYLSPIKAEAAWYNQDFKSWLDKVDNSPPSEIFGERYTSAQVEWVIYGLFAFVIHHTTPSEATSACSGGDIIACSKAVKNFLSGLDNTNKSTQTGNGQSLAALIFADRPLSGISYVRERVRNLSLVPTVHAAQTVGVGFSALSVVQNMWKSFRDIAFGLFVVVAIVFAFMIMFRVKLSPQLVVSVQSALPKIIVALILVTFSYAIAGLLIDVMYLVIGLISTLMAPLIPVTWFQTTHYQATGVFNLLTVGPITPATSGSPASAGGVVGLLGLYLGPLALFFLLFLIIGLVFSSTGVGSVMAFIFLFLILIAIIILLWISIKVIWGLFKAFANVLLLTIFAPIQFALGPIIPNLGFGKWIQSYLSNLSVFVVTGVLALFAWIFSTMAWNLMFKGADLTLSTSGTTASPWPPLLGSGSAANLLFVGVSFVIFTLIPKANELVQSFISGKPFAYGTAIGEAFTPAKAAWGLYGAPRWEGLRRSTGEKFVRDDLSEITKSINKFLNKMRITQPKSK